MLRGNSLAKIDGKGRLKVPSLFRSDSDVELGTEFFVTSIGGASARIYPIEIYSRIETRLRQASSVQPLVAKLRNALNFFGQMATMDVQGRIMIHPLLRDKARLDGEVAVLGQQDYLEVWNRTAIEEQLRNDPLTGDELRELASFGI